VHILKEQVYKLPCQPSWSWCRPGKLWEVI